MDAASTSSGTPHAGTMTGNTRLIGASAPETPLTGKGKAAVPQKTLPDRYPALLFVLDFTQRRTYSHSGRTHSPKRATQEDDDGVEDPGVSGQEADSEPFTPTQCLFCSTTSPDFGSNLSHMSKSHSLFIPTSIDNGSLTLAVDLETLVRYLHLVISTYHECLLCHTQRQSAHAVRQHMTGKGHCRIDLEDGESEFRDFYESARRGGDEGEGDSSGEETAGSVDEVEAAPAGGEPLRLREGSLLLASGKLLSHRSAPAPKHHRPLAETQKPTRRGALASASSTPQQPSEDGEGSPSNSTPDTNTTPTADTGRALTRLERRAEASGKSTLAVAMSRMSLNDRAALAHLPVAEQRAVVLRQFKQQDRARHESRRFWSKIELPGYKTAKK